MVEGRLEKPVLRNLHILSTRKHLVGMVSFGLFAGAMYKFLINDPSSRRIEEFYKHYDPEAALKRMDEAGLMQSTSDE